MSTFILVHGSTQSPTGWDLLASELARRGHASVCVDLPVDEPDASATHYAQVIAASCVGLREPMVVAHSASGLFLPLVPAYAPISRLIYLAAAIPQIGAGFLDQYRAAPEMYCPAFVGKDPSTDRDAAMQYLFHDCDEDTASWALTTLRRMLAKQTIVEISPLERWPDVPSSYISCHEDRTINPDWWERAARERLGVEPIVMNAAHCPHVSRPAELASILIGLSAD
jgi:pimeloyl-ACP methyl ester carboxylesterase